MAEIYHKALGSNLVPPGTKALTEIIMYEETLSGLDKLRISHNLLNDNEYSNRCVELNDYSNRRYLVY